MEKLSINKILDAQKVLKGIINYTSLNHASSLVEGFDLYVKMESLQKTGSFKLRGAYYKIYNLSIEEKEKGIIAASAGNHAQGVALTSQLMGVKSTIVMPKNAPLAKIDSTASYGAEVILYGDTFQEAYNYAHQLEKEKGYTFIEPYDDVDVIAGQGTIGLEILEQCPDVDAVFVPVGGGGLASGVAFAIKTFKPNCKVYGVEAKGVNSMELSIMNEKVVKIDNVKTIADGIAVSKVGNTTYELCKNYLDGIIEIDDELTSVAILKLLEKCKIVSEGAGAIAVAACLSGKIDLRGKKVVSILSGGNIDVTLLSRLIDVALKNMGRKVEISTTIPDRPGQLSYLINLISNTGANILKIDHSRLAKNIEIGSSVVDIELETLNQKHIDDIIRILKHQGYYVEIL